jgi:hypothetical protein
MRFVDPMNDNVSSLRRAGLRCSGVWVPERLSDRSALHYSFCRLHLRSSLSRQRKRSAPLLPSEPKGRMLSMQAEQFHCRRLPVRQIRDPDSQRRGSELVAYAGRSNRRHDWSRATSCHRDFNKRTCPNNLHQSPIRRKAPSTKRVVHGCRTSTSVEQPTAIRPS